MGPIGNFFSRFANFLISKNIKVYKLNFPLKFEVGFPNKKATVSNYDKPIEEWEEFITHYLLINQIKHIFMSADFYLHHNIAIKVAKRLNIDAYVFELGYVRPNFVTLEKNQVNARSNLNNIPQSFYLTLPNENELIVAKRSCGPYLRKLLMPLCFIQQCMTNYKIIDGDHKSNPKFRYLYNQFLGTLRKPYYKITEHLLNKKIIQLKKIFFVPLQVETDSQLTLSSTYDNLSSFIEEVLRSFSKFSPSDSFLVFKHHPADRGYTNFKSFISRLSGHLNISNRVFYTHDLDIDLILESSLGCITINSSVGLDALKANVPTKVMGQTFYDLEGVTYQGRLDDFWQRAGEVDRELFKKFYNHMVRTTQINGHFQGYFPFNEVFQTI